MLRTDGVLLGKYDIIKIKINGDLVHTQFQNH